MCSSNSMPIGKTLDSVAIRLHSLYAQTASDLGIASHRIAIRSRSTMRSDWQITSRVASINVRFGASLPRWMSDSDHVRPLGNHRNSVKNIRQNISASHIPSNQSLIDRSIDRGISHRKRIPVPDPPDIPFSPHKPGDSINLSQSMHLTCGLSSNIYINQ